MESGGGVAWANVERALPTTMGDARRAASPTTLPAPPRLGPIICAAF